VRPLGAEERKGAETEGYLLVEDVTGAAAQGRCAPGDVILGVNGKPVKSVAELKNATAGARRTSPSCIEREGQPQLRGHPHQLTKSGSDPIAPNGAGPGGRPFSFQRQVDIRLRLAVRHVGKELQSTHEQREVAQFLAARGQPAAYRCMIERPS
jgi:hypothetical protein